MGGSIATTLKELAAIFQNGLLMVVALFPIKCKDSLKKEDENLKIGEVTPTYPGGIRMLASD